MPLIGKQSNRPLTAPNSDFLRPPPMNQMVGVKGLEPSTPTPRSSESGALGVGLTGCSADTAPRSSNYWRRTRTALVTSSRTLWIAAWCSSRSRYRPSNDLLDLLLVAKPALACARSRGVMSRPEAFTARSSLGVICRLLTRARPASNPSGFCCRRTSGADP